MPRPRTSQPGVAVAWNVTAEPEPEPGDGERGFLHRRALRNRAARLSGGGPGDRGGATKLIAVIHRPTSR